MRISVMQLGPALAALLVLAGCGGKRQLDDVDPGGTSQVKPSSPDPTDPSNPDPDPGTKPDPDPDPEPVDPATPVVDLRADVNRDGLAKLDDAADDANEETWTAQSGAIFLANIDLDDSSRCQYSNSLGDDQLAACHDGSDEVLNGADDLQDLAPLMVAPWPNAPAGTEAVLRISPAAANVRIFKKTGTSYTVYRPGADVLSAGDIREGVELRIEGKDIVRNAQVWDGFVDVALTVTAPGVGDGAAIEKEDKVRLRLAPVMLFHHLTPAETTFVSRVPSGQYGTSLSTTFVNSLKGLMSGAGVAAPLVEVPTGDLWNQDYFETGFMSMPKAGGGQHVIRVNFRSANIESNNAQFPLRTAGRVVFLLRGKDSAGVSQYDRTTPGDMQTLNSFGNTETVPPYTHNGQTYPMGRILRGDVPSFFTDRSFKRMLESQKVQPPIYIDTSWLLVAHVDETLSFVKASTPRGWVLLLNDPRLAIQMLQDLEAQGKGSAKLFVGKSWPDFNTNQLVPAEITVSQLLDDTEVMAESTKSAAEVDAQLAILKKEIGLTEADIVRIPFLHFTVYGASVAYQPGTVNGFYPSLDTFISPKPHGPVINGKDVFEAHMEQALAAKGINVRWLENWDLYHVNLGEVHCGTNAARAIPDTKWWESGR